MVYYLALPKQQGNVTLPDNGEITHLKKIVGIPSPPPSVPFFTQCARRLLYNGAPLSVLCRGTRSLASYVRNFGGASATVTAPIP